MENISGIYHLDRSPISDDTLQRFIKAACGPVAEVLGEPRHGIAGLVTLGIAHGPTFAKKPGAHSSWVVLDGRIDNRDDLLPALHHILEENGLTTEEANDADWVLAAFQKWGDDSPNRLIGDYAFVIWDADARKVFAARDPSKLRPLYYTFDGKRFAFTSDPEVLLEGLCLTRAYDEIYLTTYMAAGGLNWERTPYKAIKQVPGGWRLSVDSRGTSANCWWEIPEPESLRYRKVEDYYEQIRELYRLAVGARMRSNKKVAIALSRGIDSSSIAATAAKLWRGGHTSCAGVEGITVALDSHPEGNESADAAAISRHLGIDHKIVSDAGRPYLGDHRSVMKSMFEPCFTAGIWNFWDAIRSQCADCDVLLDGEGGDLLFGNGGFIHTTALLKDRKYMSWLRDLRRWAKAGSPLNVTIKYTLDQLKHPEWIWHPVYAAPWIKNMDFCQPKLYAQAAKDMHPILRQSCHHFVDASAVGIGFDRSLFRANGIELLHPLWDRRLIEFSCSLPIYYRFSVRVDGSLLNKALQRRAFERVLPLDITKRNANYDGYFGKGFSQSWRVLNQILENPGSGLRSVVDLECLRDNMCLLRRGNSDRRPLEFTYSLACWLAVREDTK